MCDALHDSVPFVPFKKHEKHPWRSVILTFFKLYIWYIIAQRITYATIFLLTLQFLKISRPDTQLSEKNTSDFPLV